MSTPAPQEEAAKARDDGGPAFPQNDAAVNRINNEAGMSMRDYLAAHVTEAAAVVEDYLPTNIMMKTFVGDGGELSPMERHVVAIAKVRLMIADAVLAARGVK